MTAYLINTLLRGAFNSWNCFLLPDFQGKIILLINVHHKNLLTHLPVLVDCEDKCWAEQKCAGALGRTRQNPDVIVLLLYYVKHHFYSLLHGLCRWFLYCPLFTYYVLLTKGFSLAGRRQFQVCVGNSVAFNVVRGTASICYKNLSYKAAWENPHLHLLSINCHVSTNEWNWPVCLVGHVCEFCVIAVRVSFRVALFASAAA